MKPITFVSVVAMCLGLLGPAGCGSAADTESDDIRALAADATRGGPQTTDMGAERDPCSLVTREELENIRGGPLYEGEPDDDTCRYDAKMKDGRIGLHFVAITAGWTDARAELQAWRAAAGFMDGMLRSTEGMSTVSGEDLSGIGDEAFFVSTGIMDFLAVRKGNAFVKIEAMGPRAEAIAIARLAVERL